MQIDKLIARQAAILIVGFFVSGAYAVDSNWNLPTIPEPQVPDHTFNITDYGAIADGKTDNAKAITDTIEACAKAGGGTVRVPGGIFFTGPFGLASNLNLHLDEG